MGIHRDQCYLKYQPGKSQKLANMVIVEETKVMFFNEMEKIDLDTDKPLQELRDMINANWGVAPEKQRLKFGRKTVMGPDATDYSCVMADIQAAKPKQFKITVLD